MRSYDLSKVTTDEVLADLNTLRAEAGEEPLTEWNRTKSELANEVYEYRRRRRDQGGSRKSTGLRGAKMVTCRSESPGYEDYKVVVIDHGYGRFGAPLDPEGKPMRSARPAPQGERP